MVGCIYSNNKSVIRDKLFNAKCITWMSPVKFATRVIIYPKINVFLKIYLINVKYIVTLLKTNANNAILKVFSLNEIMGVY